MANPYTPGIVDSEYSAEQIQLEFEKIASALAELTLPIIILTPQNAEPARRSEGMVAYADGTNWNPGAGGKGLYQYDGTTWVKL